MGSPWLTRDRADSFLIHGAYRLAVLGRRIPLSVRAGSATGGQTIDNRAGAVSTLVGIAGSGAYRLPDLGRRRQANWSSSLLNHGRHGLPEICQRRRLDSPSVPLRHLVAEVDRPAGT